MDLTSRIRFIPMSRQPSNVNSSLSDAELWNATRSSLRVLGIRLSIISVSSLAFRASLVLLKRSGVIQQYSSTYIGLSALVAEALPSTFAIILLLQYPSGRLTSSPDASLSTSGVSVALLTPSSAHDGDQQRVAWLHQFMNKSKRPSSYSHVFT